MIVHKCDICKKEMGVWISVKIDIGSRYASTNVADLIHLRGEREICEECFLNRSVFGKMEAQHD